MDVEFYNDSPVFLTGTTGYVGGRLAPHLLARGHSIRCLARSPRKLTNRKWTEDPRCDVIEGDVSDTRKLAAQMQGCRVAYYLVHSMIASGSEYAERDRALAEGFAAAAREAGVERIIYLGGLGELGDQLSEHLRSRREVERALAGTGVPVTTLRAAMIIGSGSASFEILRYLVERLPVMITPRWVRTECQPVAIRDVLHWLAECIDRPETTGQTLEIGGPDIVTYQALMRIMAEELGIRPRVVVPVPVLTPTLSSHWIGLVTPVDSRVGRPLAEGLRNRVVVTSHNVQDVLPHKALDVRSSIRRAVERLPGDVATHWSSAGVVPGDPEWAGGTTFVDQREVQIDAPPEASFAAVCRIGGGHGWYAGDILWRIRGAMDKVVGGPGLRRGRRHPEQVEFGEALDFWRVAGIEKNKRLSLLAEMRLPGRAMLEFVVDERDGGGTQLEMTARFQARGLLGIVYWYAVLPLHGFVFSGMLRGIRREAERVNDEPDGQQLIANEADGSP